MLQQVDDKTYMPLIETTRGDIFLAQKQYAEARQAYQLALKNADQFTGLQSMLQMKMSDPELAHAGWWNKEVYICESKVETWDKRDLPPLPR